MNERERVEAVRAFLKFNKKTFSEVLGYTYSQQYTKYLNGTTSLSIKAIKSLIEYDSRFNINWVLTGKGEMFIDSETFRNEKIINGDVKHSQIGDNNKNTINSNNSNTTEIEYLKKENKSLNKEIKSLNRIIESKDSQLKDKERLISILEKNQK